MIQFYCSPVASYNRFRAATLAVLAMLQEAWSYCPVLDSRGWIRSEGRHQHAVLRGRLRYQLEEFINSGVADEAILPLWSWICYLTYL